VAQRTLLAQTSKVCKFNIGTELRMAFGAALRASVNSDPDQFDRAVLLKATHDPVMTATQSVLRAFGAPDLRG
jgi:fructose-bisphosphate aldolase class II